MWRWSLTKILVSSFANLAAAKAHYLGEVDAWAEGERLNHITPGAGQAMTYEIKHQEAMAGKGPIIEAEAKALGVSVAEVASSVLAAREGWHSKVAAIEAIRLNAKARVRQATSAAAMYQVVRQLKGAGLKG